MFRHLVIVAGLFLLPAAAFAQGDKSDSALLPAPQEKAAAPVEAAKPQHPVAPDPSVIPQNVLQGEGAYAQALVKLPEAQKSELHELDKAFYETMVPTMEIYDMGGKLLFCMSHEYPGSQIAGDQEKYRVAFKAYQAEKNLEQQSLWQKHSAIAVKVKYIDHALMDGHYEYIQTLQKAVAEQMVDRAERTGVYLRTDCAAVQKSLEDAVLRVTKTLQEAATPEPPQTPPQTAPEAPQKAPEPAPVLAPDGTNGTLGTPSK